MGNMQENKSDTALLTSTGELSHDYELRHILSVASAYLDAGQVADAEDLLQEAMDADADNSAVRALANRLSHIKGVAIPATGDSDHTMGVELPDVLINFTSPLPNAASQSPAVQRLSRASEQHFTTKRIYSALDLTQVMCAESPDYLPGFVRLAEIQIALGKVDHARELYASLLRIYELDGEPTPGVVEALGISLNPGDTSALIGYAMTLIEAGDSAALDPFVPEAIERAVDMNVDAALEMAGAYLGLRPSNENAQRLHLKVVAASGDAARLVESARSMVTRTSPPDLLALRMAAEMTAADGTWLSWLEHMLDHVRQAPEDGDDYLELLNKTPIGVDDSRLVLATALVLNACNRWAESLEVLENAHDPKNATTVEQFAAQFARAIALEQIQHPEARVAILDAAQAAYSSDVEPWAHNTNIFGVSAAPTKILERFVNGSGGNTESPLEPLIRMRDEDPGRLDVRSALADAYLQAGSILDGIKELRFVAGEHERTGNFAGMIESMRKMSQAVPSNIDIKAKLIEGYLRRGILDEAVNELESVGGLYEERDRASDAVAAFTRAAEIASTLGDFGRGNMLFDRAVNADADNVPVRHAAVAFYLQTGSIEQAAQQLREVVRIALAVDDKDEAVAALHQIIALAPQDPEAYHKLGEVLTSLGEYSQAERVYRRLASFTPHDPVLEAKQSALAVLAASQ